MSPYDWANSMVVLVGVLFGVVSMVLVLWELVLFYRMGVEFKGQIFLNCSREVKGSRVSLQELDFMCMFWIDHCIISIGTVVWCLAGQNDSAVVGDHCPEWECRFRLFSGDIVNILLKSNKGAGGRGGKGKELDFVRGEAETESLIMPCSTGLVGGWVVAA